MRHTYKRKPFTSIIPAHLRKPEITRIPVNYEPNRTRAGVDLPQIVTVRVNGKKLLKRVSSIDQEIELLEKSMEEVL